MGSPLRLLSLLDGFFSFEPDVVPCSVSVIPLQHRNCSVFMSFIRLGHHKGRLRGPEAEDNIKCFPKNTATRYRIGSLTKVSQPFD